MASPVLSKDPARSAHQTFLPFDKRTTNDAYQRHDCSYLPDASRCVQAISGRNCESSGRKRALCIGINYRAPEIVLKGCIKDVKSIRGFLMRNGYYADDIKILTDEGDDKPTRNNILKALSWLVEGAQSNDSLFLHYSGHGGQVPDKNGDEIDQNDEAIITHERADSFATQEIHGILRSLPPRCQLTALFDSCHSGTILDLPYAYNCVGQCYDTTSGLDISADVICWSGAKDNQTSADTPEGGVMTRAFIEAFEDKPGGKSYKQLLHSIRSSSIL
ncbi:uncharacterized protein ARMOST_18624 [Armillaria ostoyae]|uniref:Peptidase C14 caspase domain-containing protein n=1 Tax=Armillaria ostoyae TaxID=47428 RepID=A0A284S2E3_ARMOS|nr:uncharacterized protein ARMOST_18624 [Armillaria ostoyae]